MEHWTVGSFLLASVGLVLVSGPLGSGLLVLALGSRSSRGEGS